MAVALDFKTFYPEQAFAGLGDGLSRPLEALLQAADDHGIKVFVGNGFWGRGTVRASLPMRRRARAAWTQWKSWPPIWSSREFYGWYWANEAGINGHFNQAFIDYAQECSRRARALMPDALTMIAPYGTNRVQADAEFARQLEALEVDIVAYQDEIGVQKSTVEQTPGYYEALRRVHDQVPQYSFGPTWKSLSLKVWCIKARSCRRPFPAFGASCRPFLPTWTRFSSTRARHDQRARFTGVCRP